MRTTHAITLSLVFVAGWIASGVAANRPHFYADDPLPREVESQDASKAARADMEDLYEMIINLFDHPKYKPSGLRAKNINTI